MQILSDILKLLSSLLLCQVASYAGSIFTIHSMVWYAALVKPEFNPANGTFAPVWTVLYILMGIAYFLVWRKKEAMPETRSAMLFFVLQLFLNILWSWLFFEMQSPGWAMLEIFFLWGAVLITTIKFFKISRWAGVLLLPILVRVAYEGLLNYYIWWLNP
ncbi:TspO/MBR family protein [Heliophilum fasciatum]|uniref:TspO/MBR related protein n=1 Tax=Heliophilum fasciatum TaxID=35700 RepID=A0A4R2RY37_9FIRM|nr:TspO/MBR family protein [Heliophilum fasciatum]MCW2277046.1 tryptophan-rich sensory protein [Heliophilum fasciatum]TCP68428.1 TspO/MBR related protein [Heliophilum fasciatum]